MFGDQFYPTPNDVIDMMVAPYLAGNVNYQGRVYRGCLPFKSIADPSAGKADILLRLADRYQVKKDCLHAIEIDFSLQSIIMGHGFKVVGTDYLEETIREHYDFFIANPPFRNGTTHLVKMWHDLYAGDIACLLNEQSILNPNSEDDRTVVGLMEKYGAHGGTKFIGSAFVDAERKTNVGVVIVWLHKDAPKTNYTFNYGNFEKDLPEGEKANFNANQLASADFIQSMVDSYNAAANAVVEIHRKMEEVKFHTSILEYKTSSKETRTLNEELADLKADFWKSVFVKTELGRVATSKFVEKFQQQQKQISHMSFSYANIMQIRDVLMFNRKAIMEECILSVFDQAIGYAPENKVLLEWKTNKSYRLNRKIIMNSAVTFDGWRWGLGYYRNDFLRDIDKAMCFISGKDISKIYTLVDCLNDRFKLLGRADSFVDSDGKIVWYRDEFVSEFFTIRFYKKGTVHLTFTDKELWQEFNIQAAQGKGWLGDGG